MIRILSTNNVNLHNCPNCLGESEIVLVEVSVDNFEAAQAFECTGCGLRPMASDQADGDEVSAKIWNDTVDALIEGRLKTCKACGSYLHVTQKGEYVCRNQGCGE